MEEPRVQQITLDDEEKIEEKKEGDQHTVCPHLRYPPTFQPWLCLQSRFGKSDRNSEENSFFVSMCNVMHVMVRKALLDKLQI